MKKSIWMALIATLAVILWLVSGRFATPKNADGDVQANKVAAPVMSVIVTNSKAETVKREVVVQGQLEVFRKVNLRAETAGLVQKLRVEKGERVGAGQVLLELQKKNRPAQIAKAGADIASKKLLVEAMQRLRKQGLQAETTLKRALADLAAAEAENQRLQLDLADTAIKAPFAGVVERRAVELGSYVDVGDSMVEIVDVDRLKAVAYVTQQNINRLELQQPVVIHLLDGRDVTAELTFIAKEADAATRSFRIEAEFDNSFSTFSAGASAELFITVGQMQAHLLSPATLTLDEAGRLGVKTLDSENRVIFNPVARVRSDISGIWVSGLADQVRVIGRGQGFVLPGETVKPVYRQADR